MGGQPKEKTMPSELAIAHWLSVSSIWDLFFAGKISCLKRDNLLTPFRAIAYEEMHEARVAKTVRPS
jgi:hypothetical protein